MPREGRKAKKVRQNLMSCDTPYWGEISPHPSATAASWPCPKPCHSSEQRYLNPDRALDVHPAKRGGLSPGGGWAGWGCVCPGAPQPDPSTLWGSIRKKQRPAGAPRGVGGQRWGWPPPGRHGEGISPQNVSAGRAVRCLPTPFTPSPSPPLPR